MENKTQKHSKVISYRKFYKARFPNAAPKRYYLERALDAALATAITVGTVTTLLFMFALL